MRRVDGIYVPRWYVPYSERFRVPPPEAEASDEYDEEHGIADRRERERMRYAREWNEANR